MLGAKLVARVGKLYLSCNLLNQARKLRLKALLARLLSSLERGHYGANSLNFIAVCS
jgi:HEPN domain-containing protein